jgi:hypothetical protein
MASFFSMETLALSNQKISVEQYQKETDLYDSMLRNSSFCNQLSDTQYDILSISIFDLGSKSYQQRFVNTSFAMSCMENTLVYMVLKRLMPNFTHQVEENRFNKLKYLTSLQNKRPHFVYLHSMITHPPFMLNKSGQVDPEICSENISDGHSDEWIKCYSNEPNSVPKESLVAYQKYVQNFAKQLKYTEKQTIETVEMIQKNDPTALIVVASDHGSRLLEGYSDAEEIEEGFQNLCTVYYPNHNYTQLYDSLNTVDLAKNILSKALFLK